MLNLLVSCHITVSTLLRVIALPPFSILFIKQLQRHMSIPQKQPKTLSRLSAVVVLACLPNFGPWLPTGFWPLTYTVGIWLLTLR